jgi:uncharacterized protein YcbK (DUF882 family)
MKLTIQDILTSGGRFPDRANSPELTAELYFNAQMLVDRLNMLFEELEITSWKISSGFRPLAVNKKIGGAIKSAHTQCQAVDFVSQEIGKKVAERPELLKKYGLWLEDLSATVSWTHLDIKPRRPREVQIFKP